MLVSTHEVGTEWKECIILGPPFYAYQLAVDRPGNSFEKLLTLALDIQGSSDVTVKQVVKFV